MGGNARYIKGVSAADYKLARDDLKKRYERILANKYVQEAGHTAKAFMQGAEAAIHDIGSVPVSVINELSKGKLAEKSKFAAATLSAKQAAKRKTPRERAMGQTLYIKEWRIGFMRKAKRKATAKRWQWMLFLVFVLIF